MLCREKTLSELLNRSMVKNGSSYSGAQCNQLVKKRKLVVTFSIGRLEKLVVTLIQEMAKEGFLCIQTKRDALGAKDIERGSWM